MPRLGPQPDEVPDATEIRAAVARVIATPAFIKSPQLAHFLTFVAEETLAGRGERLKAYTVATDAFGRDSNFDPQIDPIVRVEAGRLRLALAHYYADAGRDDAVVIEMPLGHYIPEFRRRAQPKLRTLFEKLRTLVVAIATPFPRPAIFVASMLLVAFALIIVDSFVDIALVDYKATDRPTLNQKSAIDVPTIYVDQITTSGAAPANAISVITVRERLIDTLSRFDEIEVTERFIKIANLEKQPLPTDLRADYRIGATIEYGNNDSANIAFRLFDTARNAIVWSRTFDHVRTTNDAVKTAERVADMLADLNGVIQAIERSKRATSGNANARYSCLLNGAAYWRKFDPQTHETVRKCLEETTAADPEFALGYAYLARVYSREHYFFDGKRPGEPPALDRALQAAQRAIELRPQSARAHEALLMVLAARRETAAAIAAGRSAMRLNPSSSVIKADFGFSLVTFGQVADGMALLREAAAHRNVLPNVAGIGLALGAYLSGDLPAAIDYLNATSSETAPLPIVMRIVIAIETGDRERARQLATRLVNVQPGWGRNPRRELEKVISSAEIVDRLTAALAQAGLVASN